MRRTAAGRSLLPLCNVSDTELDVKFVYVYAGIVISGGPPWCHMWWATLSYVVGHPVICGGPPCHMWWATLSYVVGICRDRHIWWATLNSTPDPRGAYLYYYYYYAGIVVVRHYWSSDHRGHTRGVHIVIHTEVHTHAQAVTHTETGVQITGDTPGAFILGFTLKFTHMLRQ